MTKSARCMTGSVRQGLSGIEGQKIREQTGSLAHRLGTIYRSDGEMESWSNEKKEDRPILN